MQKEINNIIKKAETCYDYGHDRVRCVGSPDSGW